MGFIDNVAVRVRKWFETDKDRKAYDVKKGVTPKREQLGQSWSLYNRSGYEGLAEHLRIEHDLLTRFFDYEEMDDFPEVHTAIEIYADDSTQTDSLRRQSVWVVSEDQRIKDIGNELLHDTLRIEEDIWSLARLITKYGNAYGELLLNEKGVVGVNFLPPPTMRRIEDYNGSLLGFVQDPDGRGISVDDFKDLIAGNGKVKNAGSPLPTAKVQGSNRPVEMVPFEDWEIVHWRLRSKHMRSIYGHSVLEPARWVWRRLVLLEDAAVLYKLTRAPARYAFYIDTGDLPPAQSMAYVNQIKKGYKKKKFVDGDGNLDFKVNPLGQDEDFWIPMRGGKESTRIDVLSGPDWQSMEDIQYFRQKLMTAIKVPPAYIGMGEGETRSSLAQEDVRFARTVLRIQREIRNGLKKLFRVHLSAIGLDPHAVEWDIQMTSPSSIFELQQIETRNAQADLAANLEPYFDKDWILQKVFNLSSDEAAEIAKRQEKEEEDTAVRAAEIQKKQAEIFPGAEGAETPQQPPGEPGANLPGAPGGGGGDDDGDDEQEPDEKPAKKPAKKDDGEEAISFDDLMARFALLESNAKETLASYGDLQENKDSVALKSNGNGGLKVVKSTETD